MGARCLCPLLLSDLCATLASLPGGTVDSDQRSLSCYRYHRWGKTSIRLLLVRLESATFDPVLPSGHMGN